MKIIFSVIFFLHASAVLFCINGTLSITAETNYSDKFNHTLPEVTPQISQIKEVHKNQIFSVFVAVADMANDAAQKCNTVYDLKVLKPNGIIWFEKNDLEARKDFFCPQGVTFPAALIYRMAFENEDDYGTYKVIVLLKDQVNDKELKLQSKVKLIKDFKKYNCDNEKLDDYINDYYKNPEPDKAIDYYLFMADKLLEGPKPVLTQGVGFFAEIINNNEYLIPHIYEIYPGQSPKAKMYLIRLLTVLNFDSKDFLSKVGGIGGEYYEEIAQDSASVNVPAGDIEREFDLGLLWGKFFVTGKYEPLYRIVNTLGYVKYENFLQDKINSATSDTIVITQDDYPAMQKMQIYRAVKDALKDNYYGHKLVFDYCNYMLVAGKLDEPVKSELQQIADDYIKDSQELEKKK